MFRRRIRSSPGCYEPKFRRRFYLPISQPRFPILTRNLHVPVSDRTSAFVQSNSLRGAWSGHWVTDRGAGDAVTFRFSIDDDADSVTGEMVNPEGMRFDNVSFDSAIVSVVAEAENSEPGHFRIETRIEEETRLHGMLFHDNSTGEKGVRWHENGPLIEWGEGRMEKSA